MASNNSRFLLFIVLISGIMQLTTFGILTIPKEVWSIQKILNMSISTIWNDLTRNLQCKTLCVKPARDGCSSGVAKLWLCTYIFSSLFENFKTILSKRKCKYYFCLCDYDVLNILCKFLLLWFISSTDDLRLYVKALKECLLQIPANSLSKVNRFLSFCDIIIHILSSYVICGMKRWYA